MADTEIEPLDRIYDCVTDLLWEGQTPKNIRSRVEDALRDYEDERLSE